MSFSSPTDEDGDDHGTNSRFSGPSSAAAAAAGAAQNVPKKQVQRARKTIPLVANSANSAFLNDDNNSIHFPRLSPAIASSSSSSSSPSHTHNNNNNKTMHLSPPPHLLSDFGDCASIASVIPPGMIKIEPVDDDEDDEEDDEINDFQSSASSSAAAAENNRVKKQTKTTSSEGEKGDVVSSNSSYDDGNPSVRALLNAQEVEDRSRRSLKAAITRVQTASQSVHVTCEFCYADFKSVRLLASHIIQHVPKCKVCDKVFENFPLFWMHAEDCPGFNSVHNCLLACGKCDDYFIRGTGHPIQISQKFYDTIKRRRKLDEYFAHKRRKTQLCQMQKSKIERIQREMKGVGEAILNEQKQREMYRQDENDEITVLSLVKVTGRPRLSNSIGVKESRIVGNAGQHKLQFDSPSGGFQPSSSNSSGSIGSGSSSKQQYGNGESSRNGGEGKKQKIEFEQCFVCGKLFAFKHRVEEHIKCWHKLIWASMQEYSKCSGNETIAEVSRAVHLLANSKRKPPSS